MEISVIIPARNEEKNIAEVIDGIKKYANQVYVVDGHSVDKTKEVAKEKGAIVISDNRKGKGDAIRTAIKNCKGDVFVFIDADQSHDPNDIPKLLEPILSDKADHVSGSRMLAGSDELYKDFGQFLKLIGSCIITLGINYRFNVRLTDTQNGFRAIKAKVAKELNLTEDITTIEQEMIIKTLKRGYRLAEVPTHEYERKHGKSSIVLWKVSFRYVYSWLKNLFL